MSLAVIDSSAYVDTIADPRGRGRRVLNSLVDFEDWWAPEIFDAEVAHGLRNQLLRGLIEQPEFNRQMRMLAEVAIGRIPVSPLLGRVAALSGSLTAYDAAFVAVAELLDAPLLTTDARLARAPGPRCEFLLVEGN